MPASYYIAQELQKYNIPDYRLRQEQFQKAIKKTEDGGKQAQLVAHFPVPFICADPSRSSGLVAQYTGDTLAPQHTGGKLLTPRHTGSGLVPQYTGSSGTLIPQHTGGSTRSLTMRSPPLSHVGIPRADLGRRGAVAGSDAAGVVVLDGAARAVPGGLEEEVQGVERRYHVSALGALRNLCIDGGYDICEEMYNKSILVLLRTFVPKVSTTLSQYLQGAQNAPENAQTLVYEFADNLITVLWCLSETSNKALTAINEMKLTPFLMSFLAAREKYRWRLLRRQVRDFLSQCLYVLTDDNYPAIADIRSDGSYIACPMSILTPDEISPPPNPNGKAPVDSPDPRAVTPRVLASGILRNISPIPPPSAASAVDVDKDIVLPQLQPVVSALSLPEASASALELISKSQQDSTTPNIEKLSLKNTPKTDHKSPAEIELERLEGRLRTVQLALEILTGACATMPDPEPETEGEVLTRGNEEGDDDIAEDAEDDDADLPPDINMAIDNDVAMDASTPGAPQPLPALVQLLLALIQPTTLSLPPLAAPSGDPNPEHVRALMALCDGASAAADTDAQLRVKCIGTLECLAMSPASASIEANATVAVYLLSMLPSLSAPVSPAGTGPMLQAAASLIALIDIYSDEGAPTGRSKSTGARATPISLLLPSSMAQLVCTPSQGTNESTVGVTAEVATHATSGADIFDLQPGATATSATGTFSIMHPPNVSNLPNAAGKHQSGLVHLRTVHITEQVVECVYAQGRVLGARRGQGQEQDRDRERERAEMEAREREAREREHHERGRERRDEENVLTRKIGFLTATASEDWTLVLDVCDHASATEANAKEAVRALRRKFKYGEPAAQLAAAWLWAIMLRNSSDTFISQSTSRKFLDTLEDLLTSRTSPVGRERVMDVLVAAVYAHGSRHHVQPPAHLELILSGRPSVTLYEYDPAGANTDSNNTPTNGTPQIVTYNALPLMVTYHDATPIVPICRPSRGRLHGRARRTITTLRRSTVDNIPQSTATETATGTATGKTFPH
ncbi:hypothetical protein B0H14DRAFT_3602820 [Mycena olivaceomarginata]|nr:hypothetical protein B0H14DRAFT_3602820 [Mycena olivaceomarginata]